ncbi:uncharacterized protein LOC143281635 [Babylonia areolata]|uniref:uncharacterized protein LOC143281635 n=1 Tax=Babylonia areolata TaxID=304850 RepID=UPI003FD341ED
MAALTWGSHVTEAGASSPELMKNAFFKTLPRFDVTFTQDVLWERDARSRIECEVMCTAEAQCVMATFTPSAAADAPRRGSCRMHRKRQTSVMGQEAAPGARSSALVITDFWIEKPCTYTSDCTEYMAGCFSGQCLCQGGFFFDYYLNACVSSCSWTLGYTFLEYKGYDLKDHDMYDTAAGEDPVNCLHTCSKDPKCVTMAYTSYSRCYYKHVTAQDYPESWIKWSPVSFFQKTCIL